MEQLEPACVLYVGIDCCFQLPVPRWACRDAGCGGSFAPSPFLVGCFPATPKASWDVMQSSPSHPARWIELQLLSLADSLIYQGGRPAAVYSLAAAIHNQHERNGCANLLGWEHFKRQLGEVLMVRSAGLARCRSAEFFKLSPPSWPACTFDS
jgi:hypothetical protein